MIFLEVTKIPLPEDGPTDVEIRTWAARMGLSLEEFLGRSLCEYIERLEEDDRDPVVQALYRPGPSATTRDSTEKSHDPRGRAVTRAKP